MVSVKEKISEQVTYYSAEDKGSTQYFRHAFRQEFTIITCHLLSAY